MTAWWDASQIYGYDESSFKRVKKDPADSARLLMRWVGEQPQESKKQEGWKQGYLPLLDQSDRAYGNAVWEGQEATAFPDNWSIGLSFFHNVFAREHNKFVEIFRQQDPEKDSGLRRPEKPDAPVPYKNVKPEELFEIARLVVSAEIAKIHTIEWTTQLLYDEPLYKGMNSNWSGLFESFPAVASVVESSMKELKKSGDVAEANLKYSAYAAGPGILGLGSKIKDCWHVFFCPDNWRLADLNISTEELIISDRRSIFPKNLSLSIGYIPWYLTCWNTGTSVNPIGSFRRSRWWRPSAKRRPQSWNTPVWPTGLCPWDGSAWGP